MIDPSSIMGVEEHRGSPSFEAVPPDLIPDTSSGDDTDQEAETSLNMCPAEIRVIHRLSSRTNILPVIAHADSLTDEKLQAIKLAGVCHSLTKLPLAVNFR